MGASNKTEPEGQPFLLSIQHMPAKCPPCAKHSAQLLEAQRCTPSSGAGGGRRGALDSLAVFASFPASYPECSLPAFDQFTSLPLTSPWPLQVWAPGQQYLHWLEVSQKWCLPPAPSPACWVRLPIPPAPPGGLGALLHEGSDFCRFCSFHHPQYLEQCLAQSRSLTIC